MDKKADSESKSLTPWSPSPPALAGPRGPVTVARKVAPVSFLAGACGGALLMLAHHPLIGLLVLILGFTIGAASALVAKTAPSGGVAPDADSPMQALKRRLGRSQFVEGGEKQAERALEQLRQLTARLATFEKILGERLSPSELTYGRFHGAAEQVGLSVLDSLKRCADELEALGGMNLEGASGRANALANAQGLSDSEKQELAALQERLKIRDEHLGRVSEALAANEKALTELDRAVAAIGQMNTAERLSATGLDTSLLELEEIARRAKKFS